jgi:hypothetical protein
MPSSTQKTFISIGPVSEQPFGIIYEGTSLISQRVFITFQSVVTILKGVFTIFAGILLNTGLFFASHYISFFYNIFGIVFILGIGAARVSKLFFRGAVPKQTKPTRTLLETKL